MSRTFRLIAALSTLLTVSLGAFSAPSAVKYRRYKLFELVACADLVVTGTILSIEKPPPKEDESDARTFTFEIQDAIVGRADAKEIRVACFQDWTCATRGRPYSKGEREVLFLYRPSGTSSTFTIMGAGDEGEMPITGSSVILPDYNVPGRKITKPPEDPLPGRGSIVELDEFTAALRGFHAAYSWKRTGEFEPVAELRPKEDQAHVLAFAATSALARHLDAEARSSSAWTGPSEAIPTLSVPADARCLRANECKVSGPSRIPAGRAADYAKYELSTAFGREVCFLGDLDGDGTEDMAVGAPSDSAFGHYFGTLWFLLLNPDGSTKRCIELQDGSSPLSASMNEFAALGCAVAATGDIDADGVPDVLVGAKRWDRHGKGKGGVWLLSLARDGSVKRALEIAGDPKLLAAGAGDNSGLGCSLACLGDLDHDGYPEIAIGEDPGFDDAYKNGRSVYIASLGEGGVLRWARRIHDASGGFADDFSTFGEAVAGLGDIDGDSVPDLAISNSFDSDGGESRGAVWVVFMQPDGSIREKQKISDWSGNFSGRLHDDAYFGSSLCGAGDLDRDGIPDLAVGSADGLWILSLTRTASVRANLLFDSKRQEGDKPGLAYSSIALCRSPTDAGGRRAVLGGTIQIGKQQPECALWFVRFDTKGTLLRW